MYASSTDTCVSSVEKANTLNTDSFGVYTARKNGTRKYEGCFCAFTEWVRKLKPHLERVRGKAIETSKYGVMGSRVYCGALHTWTQNSDGTETKFKRGGRDDRRAGT